MKAVLRVHSRRHAWWFWFMWHCACSESWKESTENLAEVNEPPTFYGWSGLFPRMSPVFPSQVWPDCCFPPVSVSVFSCHSLPTTTRRTHSASPHASVNAQRAERIVFGREYPKLRYQSSSLDPYVRSHVVCELSQNFELKSDQRTFTLVQYGSVLKKTAEILYVVSPFSLNLVRRNTKTHRSPGRHIEGIHTLQKGIPTCVGWINGLYSVYPLFCGSRDSSHAPSDPAQQPGGALRWVQLCIYDFSLLFNHF